jgi:hypothetical protein
MPNGGRADDVYTSWSEEPEWPFTPPGQGTRFIIVDVTGVGSFTSRYEVGRGSWQAWR